MNRNTILLAGGSAAVIAIFVIGAVGWYLFSPLLFDNAVDEAFPFELPDQSDKDQMTVAEQETMEAEFLAAVPDEETLNSLSPEDRTTVQAEVDAAAAAVMSDKSMDDPMPADEPVSLASGQFAGVDALHQGSGTATIYQLPDGSLALRLADFEVTNGPDLHVYLSRSASPNQDGVGDDAIDLGSLKGNIGSQNYEIPAGVELSEYQSVVIYCVPFHVVFASAVLNG